MIFGQIGRIFAFRNRDNESLDILRQSQFRTPSRRLLSRFIHIEKKSHLLSVPTQHRKLLFGQSRTRYRDRILDTCLMTGDDIHVPLDQDRVPGLFDRLPRI